MRDLIGLVVREEELMVAIGRFSMVCRDGTTDKARVVNPLYISAPEEKALHKLGEGNFSIHSPTSKVHSALPYLAHKNTRQNLALSSLSRSEPTTAEFTRLHDFYLRYGREKVEPDLKQGEERVWMEDTKMEMTQLMYPQHRKCVFVSSFFVT